MLPLSSQTHFGGVRNLRTLTMSGNKIMNSFQNSFGKLRSLEELDIYCY